MRILFLLSSLEPAGSETYCVSLARAWQGKHDVFWISDRLHYGQDYLALPISQKAFPGGLRNAWKVARVVRERGIDLIHSHSRRAHWVAAQASFLTKVPYVTTIHQPPPVHLFSRLFPCLGRQTIAIDEAVRDHLMKRLGRPAEKIRLIRNGIDLERFPFIPGGDAKTRRIVILGRLTGGRWPVFQFLLEVLQRMAKTLPATTFQIAGHIPEEQKTRLAVQLESVNEAIAPSTVETVGFVQDLPTFLTGAHGVIAGGRSALESLTMGKPVIVMGEGGVIGLCAPDTQDAAMHSNFGDHLDPSQFYPAKLELALRQILEDEVGRTDLGRWGRWQVEKFYDVRTVAKEVDSLYQCLISPS